MKILVTGGAGFIGSNLIKQLAKDKSNAVVSLDNYFTGSEKNHVAGAQYLKGHTKDIEKHIKEKPDIVYHLGEYSRVEKSFDDVGLVWDLNIVGTFSVLEFCRKRNIKIVYAGSSTKFGDGGLGRDQSAIEFGRSCGQRKPFCGARRQKISFISKYIITPAKVPYKQLSNLISKGE